MKTMLNIRKKRMCLIIKSFCVSESNRLLKLSTGCLVSHDRYKWIPKVDQKV